MQKISKIQLVTQLGIAFFHVFLCTHDHWNENVGSPICLLNFFVSPWAIIFKAWSPALIHYWSIINIIKKFKVSILAVNGTRKILNKILNFFYFSNNESRWSGPLVCLTRCSKHYFQIPQFLTWWNLWTWNFRKILVVIIASLLIF